MSREGRHQGEGREGRRGEVASITVLRQFWKGYRVLEREAACRGWDWGRMQEATGDWKSSNIALAAF